MKVGVPGVDVQAVSGPKNRTPCDLKIGEIMASLIHNEVSMLTSLCTSLLNQIIPQNTLALRSFNEMF